MNPETAIGFQHTVQLNQSDCHVAEIGGGAFPMSVAAGINRFADTYMVGFQLRYPVLVDIVFPRPDVFVPAFCPLVFDPLDVRTLRVAC